MLQFHVEFCCSESNVVHKVQRYASNLLFVAWDLVSHVEGAYVASTNKRLTCLRQSQLPSASWRVSSGGSLQIIVASAPFPFRA